MGNCGERMHFDEDDMEEEVMRSDGSVNVHGPNTYRHKRHVAVNDDMLWQHGIVPYEMDHSLDFNRDRINRAMRTIEKHSRIRFIERTNEEPFLTFSRLNGCYFRKGNGKHPRISLDEYITIYWNNIIKGNESQFQRLHPFEYKWSDLPFDYESIMLYNSYAFSINGRRTLETKDGKEIPRHTKLSALDIEKLGRL
ncbi:zinc metalloproteinase nas-6 [Trichonephila clavipes]|nr:zinc metalloproteinase nas-6 [Trichonephila clavipes]